MSIWVALEALACLICLLFRRKMGFLLYEIIVAGIYLLSLTMVQELDYTMSVYFAFAVFPYLGRLVVPNKAALFCLAYFAVVVVASLAKNGIVSVASLLIIHYLGPLMLIFVFSGLRTEELVPRKEQDVSRTCKWALICAASFEAAVGILAMTQSTDGRLMLNYQCVSGCIACFSMLLSVYLLRIERHVALAVASSLYFFAWAFASGTRGYIVIACLLMVVVLVSLKDARAKLLILGFVLLALATAAAMNPSVFQAIFEDSRMGESVGRRTYENQWFLNFFSELDSVNRIVGIGIGSVFGEQPGAYNALIGIGADDWSIAKIMENTTLHNFWYTTTLATGLCGVVAYAAPFIVYLKTLYSRLDGRVFFIVVVFMAAYAFVLWHRWTATGGILESAILAAFVAFCAQSKSDMRSVHDSGFIAVHRGREK